MLICELIGVNIFRVRVETIKGNEENRNKSYQKETIVKIYKPPGTVMEGNFFFFPSQNMGSESPAE